MADGVTLSARLWRPADAVRAPVPAIVEYIPYRKRDHTRARDETLHRAFAEHGYVSVGVDLRGSGESDGILGDEYCQQELDLYRRRAGRLGGRRPGVFSQLAAAHPARGCLSQPARPGRPKPRGKPR